MNEEQLIEFINWLSTAVPEFKNAEPEQIVQALNQMYESEERQQMLSQLFTAFQDSKADAQSQMFKKGGKLSQLVEKAKKGKKMCCRKKEVLQGGMVNKVAEKMQEGGELSRREAREQAATNRGYSRGQFQTAITNAKNSLRRAGLRGRELRQQAHQMVAGNPEFVQEDVAVPKIPVLDSDIVIEDVPMSVSDMPLNLKISPIQNLNLLGTFNQAFRSARNAGAKTFLWNGKEYTTDLAEDSQEEFKDNITNSAVKSASLSRDQWNDLYRRGKVQLQDIPRQYQSWIEGENSDFKQGVTNAIDSFGTDYVLPTAATITAALLGASAAPYVGSAIKGVTRGIGTVAKTIGRGLKSTADDFARGAWNGNVSQARTGDYVSKTPYGYRGNINGQFVKKANLGRYAPGTSFSSTFNNVNRAISFQDGGKTIFDRKDNVNGYAISETDSFGNKVRTLAREDGKNPGVVWYTEQRITPRDTTYYLYNNTASLTPFDAQRFVTPHKYDNMGFLGRLFNRRGEDSWAETFDKNFEE